MDKELIRYQVTYTNNHTKDKVAERSGFIWVTTEPSYLKNQELISEHIRLKVVSYLNKKKIEMPANTAISQLTISVIETI